MDTDSRNRKMMMAIESVMIIAFIVIAYLLYPGSKGWSLGLILVAIAIIYIELLNEIKRKKERIITALIFIIIAIIIGAAMFWKDITDHSEDVLIAAAILSLALVLIIFIFPASQTNESQNNVSESGIKRKRISCRIHKGHCQKKR